MDEYYRIEAKLIINSDGSKNEKGSKYNTGIYELAMIAKITKAPKTIEGSSILFRVEYSGPTIMIGMVTIHRQDIHQLFSQAL